MRDYTDDQKQEMKERLKGISSKKINTTMIYPLATFEEYFGDLWGNDKQHSERNQEELENYKDWQQVRKLILDNGNRQKKGLLAEINLHTVIFNRFTTRYIFKNRG